MIDREQALKNLVEDVRGYIEMRQCECVKSENFFACVLCWRCCFVNRLEAFDGTENGALYKARF